VTKISREQLLIVENEPDLRIGLQRIIEMEMGCHVQVAESAEAALAILDRGPLDLVLADIRMPGMDGLALLEEIQRRDPVVTVILMTAFGTIEQAVTAIKKGAYDFIRKPFEEEDLLRLLKNGFERNRLLRENQRLVRQIRQNEPFQQMIGQGPRMRQVFTTMEMMAKTDVTVLLTGESGTGKEMAARGIHTLSDRGDHPMVTVNCPALPENILESELFGYRKGAFTNALSDKRGLFDAAHNSTIFLDEIGDLGLSLQTKLLRVLQEKEVMPLGDTKAHPVDVRIIASTNRDLTQSIREGAFREDLYYRLNVATLVLPPLRDRREDLPILIEHFLRKAADELKVDRKALNPEALELLTAHTWPGNVRELENTLQAAVALTAENTLMPADINLPKPTTPAAAAINMREPYKKQKERALKAFTTRYVDRLLTHTAGNVSLAAEISGIKRQSLQKIFKRYQIRPSSYRRADEGR
jgi:DNA-binding NtrC family response regulator